MKKIKNLYFLLFIVTLITACGNDDDSNSISVRDRAEVDLEDQVKLEEYLDTHFYNYEEFAMLPAGEDFDIKFDSIYGVNANKTPLSQQVTSTVLTRNDIDYTIYTLKVRQGGGALSPKFADSALVSYKGYLLDKEVVDEDNGVDVYDQVLFDTSTTGTWFDLPNVIDGFMEGVTQFNEASSRTVNSDGTISYVDSGVGAVFMPSGVAYFNSSTPGATYAPLVFTFQLRVVNDADHDNDGILSIYEDLNGDRDVRSPDNADNTDEDIFTTTIGYNYLDADDDNDGVLTIDEEPDPNGDGNPSDARDTDGDGVPDYLDDDTAIDPED